MKAANIDPVLIVKAYTAFIRPVLEYMGPIVACMGNARQEYTLERVQRLAIQCSHGYVFHEPYGDKLAKSGLNSLEKRRLDHFQSFTKKSFSCGLNEEWFELFVAAPDAPDVRRKRVVVVPHATTERYKNSPIIAMSCAINLLFHP